MYMNTFQLIRERGVYVYVHVYAYIYAQPNYMYIPDMFGWFPGNRMFFIWSTLHFLTRSVGRYWAQQVSFHCGPRPQSILYPQDERNSKLTSNAVWHLKLATATGSA